MSTYNVFYTVASYRMPHIAAIDSTPWGPKILPSTMFHTTFGKTRAKSYEGKLTSATCTSEISHDREPEAPCPSICPWEENQERTVMMDTCRSSSLSEEFIHCGLCVCVSLETQLCLRQRSAGSEEQNECQTWNSC